MNSSLLKSSFEVITKYIIDNYINRKLSNNTDTIEVPETLDHSKDTYNQFTKDNTLVETIRSLVQTKPYTVSTQ